MHPLKFTWQQLKDYIFSSHLSTRFQSNAATRNLIGLPQSKSPIYMNSHVSSFPTLAVKNVTRATKYVMLY